MRESESDSVWTVRGPLPADRLGVTLPHEHLFVLSTEFQQNFPRLWNSVEGVRVAAQRLEDAYLAGVRTIVDMTVIGQGRDIRLVQRVAALTKVNIVVATGIYSVDGIPLFARFRGPGTSVGGGDPLTDLLIADIEEGIGGTGIRAGLVKFACEQSPPDPSAYRMADITAEVSARTGVPVVVHTDPFSGNGLPLVGILVAAGVPPGRIVVAHAGDSPDLDYLSALADTGCWLGYDRYGMSTFAPDEQRNATLAALVRAGHASQLLVSQDYASHIDYLTMAQREAIYPEWSYTHLFDRVVAELVLLPGIDREVIETLTVANPRRLLTRAAAVTAPGQGTPHAIRAV